MQPRDVRRRPQSARVRPAKDQPAQAGREFEPKADLAAPGTARHLPRSRRRRFAEVIEHLARCNVADHRGSGGENRRDRADPLGVFPRSGPQPDRSVELRELLSSPWRPKTDSRWTAAARAAASATDVATAPLFVHCCHCRWCQRETGTAFALNALIEADRVERAVGQPERVLTPSNSGQGQTIVRCPQCRIARMEPLRRRRDRVQLRARRHARRPRSIAAGHPYLHVVEAAVGVLAGGRAGRGRVLRSRCALARASLERRRVLLAALAATPETRRPPASLRLRRRRASAEPDGRYAGTNRADCIAQLYDSCTYAALARRMQRRARYNCIIYAIELSHAIQ